MSRPTSLNQNTIISGIPHVSYSPAPGVFAWQPVEQDDISTNPNIDLDGGSIQETFEELQSEINANTINKDLSLCWQNVIT